MLFGNVRDMSTAKFCTQCGAKLPSDNKFCSSCGKSISALGTRNTRTSNSSNFPFVPLKPILSKEEKQREDSTNSAIVTGIIGGIFGILTLFVHSLTQCGFDPVCESDDSLVYTMLLIPVYPAVGILLSRYLQWDLENS